MEEGDVLPAGEACVWEEEDVLPAVACGGGRDIASARMNGVDVSCQQEKQLKGI